MRNCICGLLILVACVNSSKEGFEGHWYNCGHAGQYQELHISSSKLYKFYTSADWNSPQNYIIKNDTLFSSDTLINWVDEEGSPVVVKTEITQVSKDQLRVKFIDYEYVFHRMPKEVNFNMDSYALDTNSENEFGARKEYFSCPDLRSVEEKRIDSLRMEELLEDIL
jgi:hypothetical protein